MKLFFDFAVEEKVFQSGADLLLDSLANEGVEVIFGYPGGVLLSLYDALPRSSVRHILVRHEQGAAHAADAYARVSGKIGVCLATSGPGATNLVTGIANAYMDSIPMVALTGQVSTNLLGMDSFQEADITGITAPITKHSYLVKDAREIPRVIKEAFYVASTGRPGPVLIDLPKDVLSTANVVPFSSTMDLKGYQVTTRGNADRIKEAIKAIGESWRPVIYAGGGVIAAEAYIALQQLVEQTSIPVVTTLMGVGCMPAHHPNLLGMVGMHGTVAANLAVDECDLLIAVGVRFDDRVTGGVGHRFATKAKIIHIDIDPTEIDKVVKAHLPIIGDARLVLEEMAKCPSIPEAADWWRQIRKWQAENPLGYGSNENLIPQMIIKTIGEVAGEDAIICTDVGQHQMWTAQFYPVARTRHFVTSGGLGTMGFGLPAAVGAQVAVPDGLVFLITGDGSLQMTLQELGTIAQYGLNIKIAVMNNGVLGMVRQWQKMFFNQHFSQTTLEANPDFVKLAEAYGIKGIRVTSPDEVKSAVQEAIAYPGPVLLDFVISGDEVVLPMIPPGKNVKEMVRR